MRWSIIKRSIIPAVILVALSIWLVLHFEAKLEASYLSTQISGGTALPSEQSNRNKLPVTSPSVIPTPPSKAPEPTVTPGSTPSARTVLPTGFVYISDYIPYAKLDIRYATRHNFTGEIVEGYLSDNASLTTEAAAALKKAADSLKEKGYGIKIYDSYRPKQAVAFFIEWSEKPENGKTKEEFYPEYDKKDLFKLGYIAKKSGHSRGSTVDLTIFDLKTGSDLDMGSPFDFLGPISNHNTKLITDGQRKNRSILLNAMKNAGFKELRTEWWHYTLINEPYPDTYFDFPVE